MGDGKYAGLEGKRIVGEVQVGGVGVSVHAIVFLCLLQTQLKIECNNRHTFLLCER